VLPSLILDGPNDRHTTLEAPRALLDTRYSLFLFLGLSPHVVDDPTGRIAIGPHRRTNQSATRFADVSENVQRVPAVEGWFTVPAAGSGDLPQLIGAQCTGCHTYIFPPRESGCPNPACTVDDLTQVPLSRRGRVWSYTENRYAPPPPFKAPEPYEPYALVAVELEAEGLIVLGQASRHILAADLKVGMEMELDIDVLYREDDTEYLIYTWVPAAPVTTSAQGSTS
jgi:uncharacterized protein